MSHPTPNSAAFVIISEVVKLNLLADRSNGLAYRLGYTYTCASVCVMSVYCGWFLS